MEQAAETLRVSGVRHREGRSTTNERLEAEPRVREHRSLRELARLDLVRAWLKLWVTTGGVVSPWSPESLS